MFERFTTEARSVVVAAQDEARARRADHIEPLHLLLGLLEVGEKRTTAVLRRLDVDPADLRRRLEGDADAA